MKKKFNLGSLITTIALVGVLTSFLSSSFPLKEFIENMSTGELEQLLDTVNLGLAFISLAGVFVFLIARAAKDDKTYFWDFTKDQEKDNNETGPST